MTPPDLTEDDATDLALLAIAQAFRRRNRESTGIDRTHLVKAVYRLADEFDLPITRCWFKFGQFVLTPRASPEGLARVHSLGVQAVTGRFDPDSRELLHRMAAFSERLVPFFSEPLDEFLPEYYETEAPGKYRDLYSSNFALVSFCRRVGKVLGMEGQRTHYSQSARAYVTRFHRAVGVVKSSDARQLLLDYTSFLEELVIRFDTLASLPSFDSENWMRFSSKAVDIHVDQLWTLAAAQVAADTMTGPRVKEERDRMLHTASLAERYRTDFAEPIMAEAAQQGFLPTTEDLQVLVEQARSRTGSRAAAIEELTRLMHKGE